MALAGTTACSSVLGVGTATATSSWGDLWRPVPPLRRLGPGAVRQARPEVHPYSRSSLLADHRMSTTVRSRCNSACRIRAWRGPKSGVRPRALVIRVPLGVRPGRPAGPIEGGSATRVAGLFAVAEPAEELGQRLDLLLAEHGADAALDRLDVLGPRILDLGKTVLGEDRVADSRVLLALALPD